MHLDPQQPAAAERFYSGAIRRILRALAILGVALTAPVWWFYGLLSALGFAAGAAASWINFHSLAGSVDSLADRIVNTQSGERGSKIVGRFLLRYLLVGIIAYAIFKGSSQAFRGFLAGLCLPVAAMLAEAVYEAFTALRRGY